MHNILIAREIESLKLHGRKCGSVCCSGGFIVETMLCVLVNEDVDCINLEGNLSNLIYKDFTTTKFGKCSMHVDTNISLKHYRITRVYFFDKPRALQIRLHADIVSDVAIVQV